MISTYARERLVCGYVDNCGGASSLKVGTRDAASWLQISITNVYLPVCPHQLGCEADPGVPVIPQGGAAAGLQAHQAALHLPAHLQSERRTVVT